MFFRVKNRVTCVNIRTKTSNGIKPHVSWLHFQTYRLQTALTKC